MPRRARPALSDRLFRIGKKLRHRVSAVVARSSKVGDAPLYDPAIFPWIAALERQWPAIRAELQAVLDHEAAIPPLADISPDHRRIAPPGKWKSFFLHGYGYRLEENLRRCPATAAAVARDSRPQQRLLLDPRARRAHPAPSRRHQGDPHRPSRPRRAARGASAAGCRSRTEIVHWREGQTLVFDDTFHHEVWNDTDEWRAVLLIQFRRPVGLLGKLAGGLFLFGVKRSRFVQDARAELGRWEGAMQRLERAGD